MFSRAGRSGYVLKPELLRKKGAEKDKAALTRSENYLLELEVSDSRASSYIMDASEENSTPVLI